MRTVGDDTTTGRATRFAPQQHLAGSGVQREQIASQFTREDQIARGRGDARYPWLAAAWRCPPA